MTSDVKSDQKSYNDHGQAVTANTSDVNKRRLRRARTAREREARYDKYLADRNGNSRLDPCEPSLAGLTCGAIDTAVRLMKRSLRSRQRPSLRRIVGKVSKVCDLTTAQEELLRKWLSWLIDRPWVLHERGRSPVVEWVQSQPPVSDFWTNELAASWRSKIDSKARAAQNGQKASQSVSSPSGQSDVRAVKAEGLLRPAEPGTPSTAAGSAFPPPHPRPIDDQLLRSDSSARGSSLTAAPVQGGESVRSVKPEPAAVPTAPSHPPSVRPPASPAMADASPNSGGRREMFEGRTIIIPELDTFFFKRGAYKANAFLNALKPDGFNEQTLGAAIKALLHHKEELNEFRGRGAKQREFIDYIFTQIGVKTP